MALRRTGGERTDELLGRNGSGPEGLPHSIIVTPEGVEGEVPALADEPSNGAPSSNGGPDHSNEAPDQEENTAKPARHVSKARHRTKGRRARPDRRALSRKA
jgi:DNA topoisomerase-6 subunit B